MASVTLTNLRKTFHDAQTKKEVVAVSDVNLEIRDGEFMVLVGPSGCGKTTTMRMIAGLEEITSGDIRIGDRVVNDVAPRDRNIAMVFQNYALYPHMSVYENMAFGLKLRMLPPLWKQFTAQAETKKTKDEIDRRIRETAKSLAIDGYLDRKPRALSGGQRQRVALGRAIVREPQVFLMDEPLSNLDAKLREQTRAELIQLHRDLRVTTVYVTHDQVEAMTMGQRIAVMKEGVLQQCDTPEALYKSPANMFVANFLHMNFLKTVRVSTEGGAPVLDSDFFRLHMPASRSVALTSYIGKTIVLGLRPEGIYAKEQAPSRVAAQGNAARMEVRIVEPLGSNSLLHLRAGAESLIARVEADTHVEEGHTMDFLIDADKAHVFDPDTEQAIV
jgi:multiple sugar transport system ATP-binding protein